MKKAETETKKMKYKKGKPKTQLCFHLFLGGGEHRCVFFHFWEAQFCFTMKHCFSLSKNTDALHMEA